MTDWVECHGCGTEFKVISDSDESVAFCPYCGNDVEFEEDEDEDNYDYDE